MARYLLLQYNIKNVNNPWDKKGDKNRRKGNKSKSEDEDNNNTGTAGAHVGEITTPQDSSTPSNGSSIGAHVSDVVKPDIRLAQSVQKILATHVINDPIWDRTDACEVSIDTVNSVEALACSHVVEQLLEYILRRSNQMELLTLDAYVPPDRNEDDRMYRFMDNKTNGTNRQTQLVSMIWGVPIHSRQTIHIILQMSLSSRILGLANVNHKYGTFVAKYNTV